MQECIMNEIQLKVLRNVVFSSVASMFMSNINEFFITLKGQILGSDLIIGFPWFNRKKLQV